VSGTPLESENSLEYDSLRYNGAFCIFNGAETRRLQTSECYPCKLEYHIKTAFFSHNLLLVYLAGLFEQTPKRGNLFSTVFQSEQSGLLF